jgi:hypothetical protein
MKKEIKLNTIVWVMLISLIVLSSIFAEAQIKYAYLLVVVFAIVKFLSVSFQFMETKNAHLIWKIVITLFVISYLIILLTSY